MYNREQERAKKRKYKADKTFQSIKCQSLKEEIYLSALLNIPIRRTNEYTAFQLDNKVPITQVNEYSVRCGNIHYSTLKSVCKANLCPI